MKTNEYCVGIYDDSLRRRLAQRNSEVRLAVSVIRPEDRLPTYEYADYEKLFPLPSPKLRDPDKAENEVIRMLDTVPRMLGIPVPREDMVDIGYWIGPEAAEMAAAAHDHGVGASIAVHIQVFTPDVLSRVLSRVFGEEDEDAAGKPLSQEFQEPEAIDDDDDDDDDNDDGDDDGYDGDDDGYNGDVDEQVRGSKRQRDDDDDDDDDDDEQVRGSTKRQRARVI